MKRRKNIFQLLNLMAISLLFVFLCSCNENKNKEGHALDSIDSSEVYTCPMHPEISQTTPGSCSICHMDLENVNAKKELDELVKPTTANILSTLKTVKVETRTIPVTMNLQGFLDYDNRYKHNIASRFSGRIEKLFIKNPFQKISKGDKLFEIYSPELVTAQENLLYLLKNDAEAKELIDASKRKLILLGFKDEMLEELMKKQKVNLSVPIYSNFSGIAIEAGMEKGMNKNFQTNSTELKLKEGMYVEKGETVFYIVETQNPVAKLKVKMQDAAKIKKGKSADLYFDESRQRVKVKGIVDLIEPFSSKGDNTFLIWIKIENDESKYKIGSFVDAVITSDSIHSLWIPQKSVVDLGMKKIVWEKTEKGFKAIEINTGETGNGFIEVTSGLFEGDEIALEAHYLNDSESFISVAKD